MVDIKISAQLDHIEKLTNAPATKSIEELIWNGFDATANNVSISFKFNKLETLEQIIIEDDGTGINFNDVQQYFGHLGASWKKQSKKSYQHPLHGQNGIGRLKAFSLGSHVEWETRYILDGESFSYSIVGNTLTLEKFTISPPIKVEGKSGTKVIISNLNDKSKEVLKDKFKETLTKQFAQFLTEYPKLSLKIDGQQVDPKTLQVHEKVYDLSDDKITSHSIRLTIIEWNIETERTICLCSQKGVLLMEFNPKQKIKAKGYNFTAYLKSDYFQELENSNLLQTEFDSNLNSLIDKATQTIQTHFRTRESEKYLGIVQQWKDEQIYPYTDTKPLTMVQKAEQEVFDILAVNVQSFLPDFEKSNSKSKKFMFKLIAQALAENPESIQKIITEVLDLKKDDQDKLARLLEHTSLSNVIATANLVAERLNFLDGLENLLFGKESKKSFGERDQLHKLLEKEAWIFHEEFSLSLSEERLETVLKTHLNQLGQREDPVDMDSPVLLSDGKTGRIDLMLSKVNQPRYGEFDYLVVELKRPSQKINSRVLSQIENYAIAVASDERFQNVTAKWTFIAISNEMDSYAQKRSSQRDRPKGLIYDDSDLNITVWVKTWSEIINDARAKLQFINDKLNYTASSETSKEFLENTYKEFIPK